MNDFQEFYFLSSCYQKGINDKLVYKLVLEKVISNLIFPKTYSVNELYSYILTNYKFEIPPTYIKSIIKELPYYGTDINIKNDHINFIRMPAALSESSHVMQDQADNDSRLIYTTFNEYLVFNEQEKIVYKDFQTVFLYFCNTLVGNITDGNDLGKIFFEWINTVYRAPDNDELKQSLNRNIYSWLIYKYFYSVKRQNKKLYGFTIYFDTNILAYLLGINGNERKKYVEYLLQKIKLNNCKVVIHDYTLVELVYLISADDNINIRIFNRDDSIVSKLVKQDPESYFIALFKKYEIPLEVNKSQVRLNQKEESYIDLRCELREYKIYSRPNISEESLYHDIMLIHSTGALHKISNIYEEKNLIATCDNSLCKWYENHLKRNYSSEYSPLLTLDRINLVFWIESDKANDSDFLANTWMYVSETIPYFSNYNVNEYYKKVRDDFARNIAVPINWRSPYILLKQNLPSNKTVEDATEEDFENALDNINYSAIQANDELRRQIDELRDENKELKKIVSEPKETSSIVPTPVINIQIPKQKEIGEYSIFEILKELVIRIIKLITRKKT